MNWKQFLKPDRRKIVLTTLICILIVYFELKCSPYYGLEITDSVEGPFRKTSWEYPCGFLSESMVGLISFYISYEITLYNPIFWISHLLISYILSDLIVWIYDKYRKKRIR